MLLTFTDRETWTFINSFAPWLSAIGTLAAVLFSLYITVADRTRLEVRAWKSGRRPAYSTEDAELIPRLSIRITNSRDKEVFIDEVYWKIGETSTPQGINYTLSSTWELEGPSMLVGRVPTQMDFDLDDFKKRYLPRLVPSLLEHQKRIKIGVKTSTGKRFESKIDQALEDWFRDVAKDLTEQPRVKELT